MRTFPNLFCVCLAAKHRSLDYAERHGYIKGVVKQVLSRLQRNTLSRRAPIDCRSFTTLVGVRLSPSSSSDTRTSEALALAWQLKQCAHSLAAQSRALRRYKLVNETFIAVEGPYTGQFVYAGKKAALKIGNVLPVSELPEGTVVSNVELRPGCAQSLH